MSYYEPLFDEDKCRICGCTWDNACEGSCYWVESDLCSQCVSKVNKGNLHKAIARTILFLFKIAASLLIAWLVSLWAIPAAYAERGYHAMGGEWILIIAAFGFTYWAITDNRNTYEYRKKLRSPVSKRN